MSMGWDYASELQPPAVLLFIPHMMYEYGEKLWNDWHGKTKELREKPVPVPLCPPQIQYELTQAQTWASAVRGQQLPAWAMAGLTLPHT
jgi:hypothetical protein